MIFGTLDNFPQIEKGYSNLVSSGSQVVGLDFLNNLIKYAKDIEEFWFFIDNRAFIKNINKKNLDERIRIRHTIDLKQKQNFDILHSLGPDIYKYTIIRNKLKCGFPITGLIHSIVGQLYKLYSLINLNKNVYSCDSIICSSLSGKESLKNILEDTGLNIRLDHIPFGIDSDKFKPRNKEELRQRFNLPDRVIALSIARFDRKYKMDLFPLLNIIKNIKEMYLILGGADGPYREIVEKFIKDNNIDNVRVINNINEEDKSLLYSASDFFVSVPDNVQETFGLTILEAMSSGLPVIVSDWNGYKELVDHNKDGFKVDVYWDNCLEENYSEILSGKDYAFDLTQSTVVDNVLLRKYIEILVRDEGLRKKMGKNGRDKVMRDYNWENIIRRYEMLWRELRKISENIKFNERSVFEMDYYKVFRNYPSKNNFLNKNINFVVDKKIDIVKFFNYYNFNDLKYNFSLNLLKEILNKGNFSLNDLENSKKVKYCIMWLLKHGIIKIKE